MSEVSGERVRELRRTEEWFDLVTGSIDEAILVAAADLSDVEYASPAYEDLFGRSVESLYEDPRSFLEAVHPADREAYEADLAAMVADFEAGTCDRVYEDEYRLGEGDDVRWIRVERYPVEADGSADDAGSVERFVVVVEEVTERRELERTYRDVFEHVSDGLVVHDPETGEIREVNDRYCELTGYARDELVGDDIGLIVPEDPDYTLDDARERIERARDEGPQLFEFKGLRKDGDTFLGEIHLTVVEIRGEERVLASVRDVTERKRQERTIRHLHESTERIQNAKTRHEVCEAAVEAASEVLELSMPACWLAGEDGTLAPVAASDAAWDLPGGPGQFDPGTFEHDLFEAGETRVYDPSERWDRTPLDLALLVPLGDHGLLGAADPAVEAYGDTVVDAARTLARHTTAALDRVDRARERRESERRLRTILERIDEAVLLTDESHLSDWPADADYLTSGYEAIWGRPYDELVAVGEGGGGDEAASGDDAGPVDATTGIVETVVPEDRERYREAFDAVVAAMDRREATDGRSVEYRIERPDGEVRWVHSDVYPLVWDEAGHRLVVVSRDVTERRRTEERLQRIADRVDEVVYMASPDMTDVEYVSPGYEDIWGRPPEELRERPFSFLEGIHPEDREAYRTEMERMLAAVEAGEQRERYDFEYRVQRPDGQIRHVEATGYPLGDGHGGGDRIVGFVRDVTERERRQETLSSFHEATREMTEMESRDEASRRAVDVAERILGFPLVSVLRYDETDGCLRPVAATDRLADQPGSLPTVGPGDGLAWQVFVESDTVQGERAQTVDAFGPESPPPDLVLPLGPHGVMLVGAPDREFATETVELAQILAATLEAALNHVRGRRELRERERRLAEHRERADRLERLNTVIREVEQATVERSSRAAIEEAVCDRLTTVETYRVAWAAEPDASGDSLVRRASAGDDAASRVARDLDLTDDAPGRHPATRAFDTGDVQVVEHLATDARSGTADGGWRTAALRVGLQSLVAVPLAHEDTVYGVVTVGSDDPAAFDEETREVLSELGRSVGYTVSVLERRAALESDTTTELTFDVTDPGLLFVRLARATAGTVSLDRTVRRSGGTVSTFYTVEEVSPDRAVEQASSLHGVESVTRVSADETDGVCLLDVTTDSWFGSVFTEYGAVVREVEATDGEGRLVVEVPRGATVRRVVESFQNRYEATELVAQRTRERTVQSLLELRDLLGDRLTDRQEEALETAYSAGYFDWPRESSSEDVADLLDVTQPTFNKHLRTAERKAFELLIERATER